MIITFYASATRAQADPAMNTSAGDNHVPVGSFHVVEPESGSNQAQVYVGSGGNGDFFLTADALAEFRLKRQAIARGDFVEIRG